MLLRNGADVHKETILATTVALDALETRGMQGVLALYELYMKANDPTYLVRVEEWEVLTRIGLLQEDGKLHRDTAAVVLSSYVREGDDFRRVHPAA